MFNTSTDFKYGNPQPFVIPRSAAPRNLFFARGSEGQNPTVGRNDKRKGISADPL